MWDLLALEATWPMVALATLVASRRDPKPDSCPLSHLRLRKTSKDGAEVLCTAFGFGLAGDGWVLPVFYGRDEPNEPGDRASSILLDH